MRPPVLRLHQEEFVVDNFAGGGGASTGLEWAIGRSPDIAINHDPEALAMHEANHPHTRHYCESVWTVDPIEVCGGRPVGLAWFSPDCTFHSKARGAKPFRDRDAAKRRRGLAWIVVRWAKAVRPRIIALENVEEFEDWGPLLDDGLPDPLRRGFTFRRWKKQLENMGYVVESRQLKACDYGAPTSRKRLFVVARCDGQPITWPQPTHGPGRARPFRTAAECIDWTIPCPSIFDRARPLAENTMRRIARGVRRYVLESAEPFIVPVKTWGGGGNEPRSLHEPMRTITASKRGEFALVTPFVARTDMHKSNAGCVYPTEDPLRTITTGGSFAIVAPTLIQTGYGERPGQAPRSLDLHAPLGTIVAGGAKHALVAAFLAKHYGGEHPSGEPKGGPGVPLTGPLGTVTTQDHHHLVTSHLLQLNGSLEQRQISGQDLRRPFNTVTAGGQHFAEVRAFLLKYFGTDQDPRLEEPLHTITTRHRFGLVTVYGVDYVIVDIGMRMLTPRELFLAQGFRDTYVIDPFVTRGELSQRLTKTAQVRMCGNSVPPHMSAAIAGANFVERQEELEPRRAPGMLR